MGTPLLYGETPFFDNPNYLAQAQQEYRSSARTLPTAYTWTTESKYWRITKLVLSIIIFPIGIYKVCHALVGKCVVLASMYPFRGGVTK